jgi:hypothetical protein
VSILLYLNLIPYYLLSGVMELRFSQMFLDSGASRSVIRGNSPLKPYLNDLSETNGSCSVGNGASLQYLQKGFITSGNEVTVVKDLQYDLYAAVAAAKRGVSCVLDFNSKGENQSYLLYKNSGTVTPLIERKSGILEIPVHLYINKDGYDNERIPHIVLLDYVRYGIYVTIMF